MSDLDLTTLSNTFITKTIANIDQRFGKLEDQERAIQDQRDTLWIERKRLQSELDRREGARPYTDAERRQLDADFARSVYEGDTDPAEL